MGADVLQADEVLVGVEGIGLQLDHGHGDVGAVVGHPLVVGQQVVKDKALAELADAPLEAVHMVELHLVAQGVDQLLQRLDAVGQLQVVGGEGRDGVVGDLLHGGEHGLKLPLGPLGEDDAFLVDLLGALGDVHGVVADALHVADGVEELGHVQVLLLGQLFTRQFDEVGAELILVFVDDVFPLGHELELLLGVVADQIVGILQVGLGLQGHVVQGLAALLDGHGGVLDQAGFQAGEVLLFGTGRLVVLDELADLLLDGPDEGGEDQDGGEAEEGVQEGDAHGVHRGVHKAEVGHAVHTVKDHAPDDGTQHVDEQVDEGRPLAVHIGPQGGQQYGHGRANGDAHDEREGHGEGDNARDRQRLQDTHGGGGTLQHAGEDEAHQNA